jgi:hypothetical protein
MVLLDLPISQPDLDIFSIWTSINAAGQYTTNPVRVDYSENCVLSAGAIQKICVVSKEIGSDNTSFLTKIQRVNLLTLIGSFCCAGFVNPII